MKKLVLGTLLGAIVLNANIDIYLNSGIKDYTNSKIKVGGKTNTIGVYYKNKYSTFNLNYTKIKVNRIHLPTKNKQSNVDKFNLNYKYKFDDKLSLKTNYIKIIDNLAPTDQGKIYGIGVKYNFIKGFGSSFDIYKSDYKAFNVNQYDLSIHKEFKAGDVKSKIRVIVKKINIDGDKYLNYTFKDKDYLTIGIKLNSSYNGYVSGIGLFFGKRAFAVLKDGTKVQHHAMEQDRTYIASFGKKFKKFDIFLKYSYQNGTELPENQNNVDTKVASLILKYKF